MVDEATDIATCKYMHIYLLMEYVKQGSWLMCSLLNVQQCTVKSEVCSAHQIWCASCPR